MPEAEFNLVSLCQKVLRRSPRIPKASQHLADVAATDPGALQTVLVGAALLLTVGAAVFNGLKASLRLLYNNSGGAADFKADAFGHNIIIQCYTCSQAVLVLLDFIRQ